MPEILRHCPEARCLIAGKDWGDGRFAARLEELVAEHGLHGSVEFLGQRQDIPDLIARSACVVVPSRMETFGMVVLEAMALSRPVVASRTGGLPEIVEDGVTGLLAAPDDPQALAQAIVRMLKDPAAANEMGKRGHDRWLREFTARLMAERTARFYDRLLGVRIPAH
jgi:glycosyltransferase involved in cell wall biosynthesis